MMRIAYNDRCLDDFDIAIGAVQKVVIKAWLDEWAAMEEEESPEARKESIAEAERVVAELEKSS